MGDSDGKLSDVISGKFSFFTFTQSWACIIFYSTHHRGVFSTFFHASYFFKHDESISYCFKNILKLRNSNTDASFHSF